MTGGASGHTHHDTHTCYMHGRGGMRHAGASSIFHFFMHFFTFFKTFYKKDGESPLPHTCHHRERMAPQTFTPSPRRSLLQSASTRSSSKQEFVPPLARPQP